MTLRTGYTTLFEAGCGLRVILARGTWLAARAAQPGVGTGWTLLAGVDTAAEGIDWTRTTSQTADIPLQDELADRTALASGDGGGAVEECGRSSGAFLAGTGVGKVGVERRATLLALVLGGEEISRWAGFADGAGSVRERRRKALGAPEVVAAGGYGVWRTTAAVVAGVERARLAGTTCVSGTFLGEAGGERGDDNDDVEKERGEEHGRLRWVVTGRQMGYSGCGLKSKGRVFAFFFWCRFASSYFAGGNCIVPIAFSLSYIL